MPAPSLTDICTRVCIRQVSSLTDVGSFAYFQIRPVLKRVTNPEQLHTIEENSPQIKGDDAELWQAFIARDIPTWRGKNYVPKDVSKWYEVYCRYKKEQKREIQRDEDALRATMMGLQKKSNDKTVRIVSARELPKLPRDPRMIANDGGVPLKGRNAYRKEGPSSLNWTSGSKTKLTDGRSVLTRARREAKEIKQMSKLQTPTHLLKSRMGQVAKAPAGMSKEYQIKSQPTSSSTSGLRILSKRSRITDTTSSGFGPITQDMKDGEAKLRRIQSGAKRDSGVAKPQIIGSDSEEDEEYYDGAGDLFDVSPPPRQAYNAAQSTRLMASSIPFSKVGTSKSSSSISSIPSKPSHSSSRSSATAHSPPALLNKAPPDLMSSLITQPHQSADSLPPKREREVDTDKKPMMMPRKRAEVDIFNRGASKRQRR